MAAKYRFRCQRCRKHKLAAGRKVGAGRRYCAECKRKRDLAGRHRIIRARRAAQVCVTCAEPLDRDSICYCPYHLMESNRRAQKRQDRLLDRRRCRVCHQTLKVLKHG